MVYVGLIVFAPVCEHLQLSSIGLFWSRKS